MKYKSKNMSITLDSGHLTMKGSSKAIIKTSIKIAGTNSILPIEIVGEFKDIPENLHQIYMQSMLASYGSVNVYDNTKPEKPEPNKKFWQIKVGLKNYYALAKFLLTLLQLRRQEEQNNMVETSNTKEK
jgi:hypothetical protein